MGLFGAIDGKHQRKRKERIPEGIGSWHRLVLPGFIHFQTLPALTHPKTRPAPLPAHNIPMMSNYRQRLREQPVHTLHLLLIAEAQKGSAEAQKGSTVAWLARCHKVPCITKTQAPAEEGPVGFGA